MPAYQIKRRCTRHIGRGKERRRIAYSRNVTGQVVFAEDACEAQALADRKNPKRRVFVERIPFYGSADAERD